MFVTGQNKIAMTFSKISLIRRGNMSGGKSEQ